MFTERASSRTLSQARCGSRSLPTLTETGSRMPNRSTCLETHHANCIRHRNLLRLSFDVHSTTTTVVAVKLIGPNWLSSGVTVRYWYVTVMVTVCIAVRTPDGVIRSEERRVG